MELQTWASKTNIEEIIRVESSIRERYLISTEEFKENRVIKQIFPGLKYKDFTKA
jgi:hypothetical protein